MKKRNLTFTQIVIEKWIPAIIGGLFWGILLAVMLGSIAAHASTRSSNEQDLPYLGPGKALTEYCPGWCCPNTDNEALAKLAWDYCKTHPNATKPSKELQALFNAEEKVNSEIYR